jgi:PAS domain S-box-containing protein
MMVLDREGSILYINHTVPGFEISQVLNTSAFNYMPPDARESFEEYLRSAYEESAESTYQMVASGPQGARAVYDSHMIPVVVDEKVVAVALTTRDVTAQHEQDKQRKAVEESGSSLQKAQSLRLLASGVAHDFNNLIGVIMANASRALRRSENEAVRESLDVILRASQSAGDLTKQLLAYSGEQHSESTVADLSLQVASMKKLMRAAVPASIDMKFELSENVPVVDVDVSKLQHAVLNLVINGRDAIGEGAGALTIRTGEHDFRQESDSGIMMCDSELRGKCAVLEVEDDGCGFDEEIRKNIFDPFFTTKESGKGLGLAVVVGVMRAHGGAVAVTSRRGEGTVFRIFFPEKCDRVGQSAGKPSRLGAP